MSVLSHPIATPISRARAFLAEMESSGLPDAFFIAYSNRAAKLFHEVIGYAEGLACMPSTPIAEPVARPFEMILAQAENDVELDPDHLVKILNGDVAEPQEGATEEDPFGDDIPW